MPFLSLSLSVGKHALLLIIILSASGAYTQRNLAQSHQSESAARTATHLELLAREAAQSGYAEAVHLIDTEPLATLTTRTGVLASGRYRTTFDVTLGTPTDIRFRVEGFAEAPGAKPARHVIEAHFQDLDGVEVPTDPETLLSRVPPYLRYAALSDETLRFTVLPRVRGASHLVNADVHTNGDLDLSLSLSAILGLQAVRGFGTYAGSLYSVPLLSDPEAAFRPASNPDLLSSLRSADPVPMPRIDVDSLSRFATQTRAGGLELLGSMTLGTRESPEIVHVTGDLVLADVTFDGYGVFLVDGGLVADGTLTGVLSALLDRPESRVAFYVDGPVLFNGVGDVQGQFVSNESITFAGAATLYGNVAAGGAVNFLVAPSIRFLPPSPALTTHLPDAPPAYDLDRLAVREWEAK